MSSNTNKFKFNILTASVLASLSVGSLPAFAEEEKIETIEVTGIRGSLIESMNKKRFSGNVSDSITAVDIGKLPDATIADSLQRITGIQITREGGEGTKVNIRGNENVTTTLNGEQMITAGAITKLEADFADIPSTMVSGIDVLKSTQAKHLVSGLAGTIDLQTTRPLSLDEGWTALGKVEATRGSLGGEVDPSVSAFVGYNLDTRLGFTLNIAKSESYLADYTNGSQGGEPGRYGGWSFMATEANNFVQDDIDVSGDGDTNDVFYSFQGHQAANRFIERDRTGINSSLQYQITDELQLTAEMFYTKLDEYAMANAITASQAWSSETGWFTPLEATGYHNVTHVDGEPVLNEGEFYTLQSALYQARVVKAQSFTRADEKEAFNSNLQLDYVGDSLSLTLRWVHGEAAADETNSVVDSFVTDGSSIGDTYHGPGKTFISHVNPWGYQGTEAYLPDGTVVEGAYTQIPVGIAYSGGKQHWAFPDMMLDDGTTEAFGSNLNRYSAKSSNLYGIYTNADLDVIRLDGKYELDLSIPVLDSFTSIEFGARSAERTVSKQGWYGGVARTNQYGDAFLARWKDTATDAPETVESYIAPISFTELNEKGMIKAIDDFHGTTGLGTLYFVDPEVMKDPIAWHNEIYGTHVLTPDAANVYEVIETVTSAYAQLNIETDIAGMLLIGNFGLRYVETEFDVTQSEALQGTVANFNGQDFLLGPGMQKPVGNTLRTVNKYNNALPALNLALNLNPDMVLRFSYTETISTHDTDNIGGGLNVNRTKTCEQTTDTGETVFCATSGTLFGNPYLEPQQNDNMELSFEWYFSESGMFNVGAFRNKGNVKEVDVTLMLDNIPDSDGVVRGFDIETGTYTGVVPIQAKVNVPAKGDWSDTGIEMGYQQGFDFLPGIWSGFGITANYTYSPGESDLTDYYGQKLPSVGQSKTQSNIAIWYEKDGLQARIAQNKRSKMFQTLKNDGAYKFAYFTAPTTYIDASVSYEVSDLVTLSLQGTNLTEEHQENYHQWESNIDGQVYAERRLTLGVQVKM
ncbi:TonB-dependent receptor [Saccharobesus litoralis]|nr:TonB-dependent receptor [Saccharobesus litoralis]